tara:strand:+ start:2510 stop:2962 length:453 start_codon:yes stop_codon:yes gene_type:complete
MDKSKFIEGDLYLYKGTIRPVTYVGKSNRPSVGRFENASGFYHYEYANMTPCTHPESKLKDEPINRYMRTIKIIEVEPSEHKQIIEVKVDFYDVIDAFKTDCPAMDHAAKKILAAGKRGYKGTLQDKNEAIQSINRSIAKQKEKMLGDDL